MKLTKSLWLVIAGVLAVTAGVSAHHSFAMFDMEKDVEYSGQIMTWKWQNPHVHFTLNVKPGPSVKPETVGTWDIEAGSINIMSKQGWTRVSFKAGDQVTLVGHPMRDGTKGVSLFYAVQADGTRLYMDVARPKQQ